MKMMHGRVVALLALVVLALVCSTDATGGSVMINDGDLFEGRETRAINGVAPVQRTRARSI